jgi:hypothetical protein
VLEGEVLPPEGDVTFEQFWQSISGNPGKLGPALAAWSRLTTEERWQISKLIGPQGIDLQNTWAAVWLKNRVWQTSIKTKETRWREAQQEFSDAVDAMQGPTVDLQPHSPEWQAERARRVAAGEDVRWMDKQAAEGKGWTVRRPA